MKLTESTEPNVQQIVGGDFDMVEWDGDRCGGRLVVIIGLEKQGWCRCKDAL